jgi:hypothetical protein
VTQGPADDGNASPADPPRLPESRRGRRSEEHQAREDALIDLFIQRLKEIRSRLDFSPGTRGWCYLAENEGMIGKTEFGRLEGLLGDWRKSGRLPLDFCGNDEKRAAVNLERIDANDPLKYARIYVEIAAQCWKDYEPVSLWEFQPVYIELAVEKSDLRTLFEKICAEYHVPIWNAGGWSDINSRADLMRRFQKHNDAGRRCVLLYCGDFDPAGLHISQKMRKNMKDLEAAIGWSPDEDRLIVDRFGLNKDFIVANDLLWIDGLETGGATYNLEDPCHPDHLRPYVQDYLAENGARKVEANALVVRFEQGRQLCREAIEKYIDPDGLGRYRARLKRERQKVRKALPIVMRRMLDSGTDQER